MHPGSLRHGGKWHHSTCWLGGVTVAQVGRLFSLKPLAAGFVFVQSLLFSNWKTSSPRQTGGSAVRDFLVINYNAGPKFLGEICWLKQMVVICRKARFTRAELTLWILLECHISACKHLGFIEKGAGSETQPLYENICSNIGLRPTKSSSRSANDAFLVCRGITK